jgi:septum formation protein
LLHQLGVRFDELPVHDAAGAEVDETPLAGELAVAYVTRLARVKAQAGWGQVEARNLAVHPVLAADTTVVLAGEILGKPDDAEHAQRLLRALSGKAHEVLSAVAIVRAQHVETALSSSAVEFRDLDDAEIRDYVASGEPFDKAGAYAIQGRAAMFVRALTGSYSGVMGLPLFATADLLSRFGIASNFMRPA